MKRILLLARVFPPRVGGIERFVGELYRRAAMRGLAVRVVTPWEPGAETCDAASPLKVCRCSKPPLVRDRFYGPLVPMALRAMREMKKFRPDEVHCDQLDSAILGLILKRMRGIPYVTFAYGMEVTDGRLRGLRNQVFRSADAVIAISHHIRELLEREVGLPSSRIHVIHPGVDVETLAPAERPLNLARQLGLTNRRVILTVARLARRERYKGHDTIIRALPAILSQVPEAAYLVVGDGPDRGRLEALARDVGVVHRVVFAGPVPDETLPDYYNLCDVFAMVSRRRPSRWGGYVSEGFGIVYLEAAACGKPAVAGDVGGVPEAVKDGETGLLVDPTSVEATAQALVLLLKDQDLAQRLGQRGRERVCSDFTWDRAADKLMTIVNTTVCDRPADVVTAAVSGGRS